MKLSDIITLAKAGYKRKDIEELLAAEEQPDQNTDDHPDYKKLYEESQKTIKKMQARNRRDPDKATEPKSADDIALEHVNALFKGV